MNTTEDRNDGQQLAEQIFPPVAESEEELGEARRKSTLEQRFDCRRTLQAAGVRQGNVHVQNQAAQHSSNGKVALGESRYERAVICFSKAITLQPEQTALHVSQAEAYLQLCDFQSAAACYKRAERLEPRAFTERLAFIHFLQGQCLFDHGFFSEALEAFRKAAEVKPGCRIYQVRRSGPSDLRSRLKLRVLACLASEGRHSECMKLLKDWMAEDGPTSELHVLRAHLHRRINQRSACYQDVKAALELNPTCQEGQALQVQLLEASERARKKAVDWVLCGQLPEALCMINIALENQPQQGHLYLFRGILYRRLKEFPAAMEDLVQAVELSEEVAEDSVQEEAHRQLVLTYNDFAVQCFDRGLYAEATLLLNKAIKEEKSQAGLYLNRGDCFFRQGDWCYALADYQQAEELMSPNDPAVRLRLAVAHNTLGLFSFQKGHFQEAVDSFSQAILFNPSASLYYEHRAKGFRKLLHLEGARRDVICMLILDPTNEELPALLMSLFPGCSSSDVLATESGRAVRSQLMENIQGCCCSSGQHRLSEQLQVTTLTSENSATQSDAPPAAAKELQRTVKTPSTSTKQLRAS
ncbi:tetratricopeptide repeat protein 16-like [Aulostomus maculatus]